MSTAGLMYPSLVKIDSDIAMNVKRVEAVPDFDKPKKNFPEEFSFPKSPRINA